MLTGRPPFIADVGTTGDVDFAIKRAHVNMQPIPPTELVSTIPAHINDVIMLALQKKPDNRLPGCQEFLRLMSEDNIKQARSRDRRIYFIALISGIFLLLLISLLLMQLIQ